MDETVIDGLRSLRLKGRLSIGNIEVITFVYHSSIVISLCQIGVVETRTDGVYSAHSFSILSHSNNPLLTVEKLSISLGIITFSYRRFLLPFSDMDMKVTSDRKLGLPSHMTLNVSSETRVNRVQLRFAVATFSLMRFVRKRKIISRVSISWGSQNHLM